MGSMIRPLDIRCIGRLRVSNLMLFRLSTKRTTVRQHSIYETVISVVLS